MLFFDSFALIEVIKGNKSYERFLELAPITTKLNLMEVYYYLLREKDEEKAEFYYNFYLPCCVSILDGVIKNAMKFKLEFKNKKLSYVDCVGYVLSLDLGIKFLTGDKEFSDLKNVEYAR